MKNKLAMFTKLKLSGMDPSLNALTPLSKFDKI